jgi:signal transduction histidine kinase
MISADWLLALLLTAGALFLGAQNGLGRFDQALYDQAEDWIRDEYVLVSRQPADMTNIAFLDHLLEAEQEGAMVDAAPAWLTAFVTGLAVLLLSLALRRAAPRTALLLSGATLAVVLLVSFAALYWAHLWIAPAAALLLVTLCYPLWCWRNQEAMLHDMGLELLRLRQEYPPILGEAQMPARAAHGPMKAQLHELRQALMRVRNLRQFLTDGFDGIADPTLVSDKDGHLRLRNRAALAYFRELALRAPQFGQSTVALLEQLAPEAALSTIGQALTGRQPDASPWRLDTEIQDRQGHNLILKCAPIRTNEGEFAGTVVTFSDITAIRQAERKREETLRFVSHDMRAPQNSILALVYLSGDETNLQRQRDAWSRVGQLARRTLRLVDDFVHLTRAESVRITHDLIDLDMMLHEAMDDFWAIAQTQDIDLSFAGDLPHAEVRGDRALLMRALCNLIDNAIKYTPGGGRVRVSLESEPGNWLVRVADNGMGIAEDDIAQLFQPFSRVGPAARNHVNGAGLGLAFVNTVAWRHGGSVNVVSQLDVGSTFTLRLPVHAADESPLAAERAA